MTENKKKKPSVTGILSQMYPMPPGMFANALSAESLTKKRAAGEILVGGIANQCKFLEEKKVMKMLNSIGTLVHACAYDLGVIGSCYDFKDTMAAGYVRSLKKFYSDVNPKFIAGELLVENDEYTGSPDAIWNIGGRNCLVDYKTWGAYKDIYGFANKTTKPNGEPYAQTSNLKKTGLQLSMYQNAMPEKYRIDERYVLWLTQNGYFLFPVPYDIQPYLTWKAQPHIIMA